MGETTTSIIALQNVELLFDQPMEIPIQMIRERINDLAEMTKVLYVQVWNALEEAYQYNHYDPFKFDYVGMERSGTLVFKSRDKAWVDLSGTIHTQ